MDGWMNGWINKSQAFELVYRQFHLSCEILVRALLVETVFWSDLRFLFHKNVLLDFN